MPVVMERGGGGGVDNNNGASCDHHHDSGCGGGGGGRKQLEERSYKKWLKNRSSSSSLLMALPTTTSASPAASNPTTKSSSGSSSGFLSSFWTLSSIIQATSLRNGSSSISDDNGLIITVNAWYAASVVCTNTSKSIGLSWKWLTLTQLIIGSFCAYFGIVVLKLNNNKKTSIINNDGNTETNHNQEDDTNEKKKSSSLSSSVRDVLLLFPPTTKLLQSTTLLSGAFVFGFVTLNMSLSRPQMHVSTVMTIRATEPVATLMLGLYFLPKEIITTKAILALVPLIVGAAMTASSSSSSTSSSSSSSSDYDTTGLIIVLVCNCLFAMRTILTKRLKTQYSRQATGKNNSLDNFTLFFQLCVIGTGIQIVLLIGMGIFSILHQSTTNTHTDNDVDYNDTDSLTNRSFMTTIQSTQFLQLLPTSTTTTMIMMILINGISFYAYLQLSWVVMGQVGAVTHSVCNALRRPVICATGWMIFGGATLQGVLGALVATAGTMLYAHAKLQTTGAAAGGSGAGSGGENGGAAAAAAVDGLESTEESSKSSSSNTNKAKAKVQLV